MDGRTEYKFEDGKQEQRKWAARFCYMRENDQLKLGKYIMQSVRFIFFFSSDGHHAMLTPYPAGEMGVE